MESTDTDGLDTLRNGRAYRPGTIDGGRAALERELIWAAIYDRPVFQLLLRQLTPSANDSVWVVTSTINQDAPC